MTIDIKVDQEKNVQVELGGKEIKPINKTTKEENTSKTTKPKTEQKKTPGKLPQECQPKKDEVPIELSGKQEIEWDKKVPIPDDEWHISEGWV